MINNQPPAATGHKKAEQRIDRINNDANRASGFSGGHLHRTLHGTVFYTPRKQAGVTNITSSGGGGGGSTEVKQWFVSSSYSVNDLARVTGSTIKYTSGSSTAYAYAGLYSCKIAVPSFTGSNGTSGVFTSSRAPGLGYIPTYPEPATSCSWWLLSLGPTTIFKCDELGTQTECWSDTVEKTPANCISQSVY